MSLPRGRRLLDVAEAAGGGLGRVDPGEDVRRLLLAALFDEPAWAFRHPEEKQEEDDRGDGSRRVHITPVRRPGAGEKPVDEKSQEDAGDDGHLVDRDEGAADAGRGDLGDVERRKDGGRADAEAADEAEGEEPGDRPREGAADPEAKNKTAETSMNLWRPIRSLMGPQARAEHAADDDTYRQPSWSEVRENWSFI